MGIDGPKKAARGGEEERLNGDVTLEANVKGCTSALLRHQITLVSGDSHVLCHHFPLLILYPNFHFC